MQGMRTHTHRASFVSTQKHTHGRTDISSGDTGLVLQLSSGAQRMNTFKVIKNKRLSLRAKIEYSESVAVPFYLPQRPRVSESSRLMELMILPSVTARSGDEEV